MLNVTIHTYASISRTNKSTYINCFVFVSYSITPASQFAIFLPDDSLQNVLERSNFDSNRVDARGATNSGLPSFVANTSTSKSDGVFFETGTIAVFAVVAFIRMLFEVLLVSALPGHLSRRRMFGFVPTSCEAFVFGVWCSSDFVCLDAMGG